MGRSCCVPGCKSNYGAKSDVSAFKFPKEKVMQEKWVKCIHRANFEVTHNSVVCIKHFDPKFIIREDVFPVTNGSPIRIKRKAPKLTDDAYPSIFPNQPSYHNVKIVKSRKDPEERSQQLLKEDEDRFVEWCEKDVIPDFEHFKSEVRKKDVTPFFTIDKEDYVLFFRIEDSSFYDIPSCYLSFKVNKDLNVKVFYKDICLPTENFMWVLGKEDSDGQKCDKWSKFDSLLSHLNGYKDGTLGLTDRILAFISFLKEVLITNDLSSQKTDKIKFAVEQLELCLSNQIRYSPELLVWAACLCYTFPGAYRLMRETNIMTLPHHTYLKQFLCKLGPNSPGIGSPQKAFLKEKSKLLNEKDKVISIMLDEIYINSKLTYKGGKILGMAENGSSEGEAASTMQVFMSASLHSSNNDVIGLFPVKKLDADTLLRMTVEILKCMKEVEFEVMCLVSDNHSVNRKMFELLCGGSLKNCVPNPADPSKPLFLLFDTVHILKCIRNNWLNVPNQTFILPDVEQTFPIITALSSESEGTVNCEFTSTEAKFSDLKNLFHSEKKFLLKLAPNLTRKCLYPTSIERQNVSLAVGVFHSTNVVALETLKAEGINISDGTIQFLKCIIKCWTMLNVKHPMKGVHLRNDDAHPIRGPNDSKLEFLLHLKTYIDIWHMSDTGKRGKLSNETYTALTHTLLSVVELCKYIFKTYEWDYILTAKLQTDSLEGRFGAYRRLSGCCYSVSVEQILESERKLKLLSVLKLRSAKFGEFRLNNFVTEVQKQAAENLVENLDHLEPALQEVSHVSIPLDTQKVLICIASYTSKKVGEKLTLLGMCASCLSLLHSNEEMVVSAETEEVLSYFRQINRGGLKRPSPFMISVSSDVYRLFQTLISSSYEPDFLRLQNQRGAVVNLGIQMCEMKIDNVDETCGCGISVGVVIKKSMKVLANILINNYTKVVNERNCCKDLATKFTKQNKAANKRNSGLEEKVTGRKVLKLSSQ